MQPSDKLISVRAGHVAFIVHLVVSKFDIWAERAINIVWNYADIEAYEQWLFVYTQAWIDSLQENGEPPSILLAVRSSVIRRLEYLRAEARSYGREQTSTTAAEATRPEDTGELP